MNTLTTSADQFIKNKIMPKEDGKSSTRVSRVTKVTLNNLDGTVSEMKLITPVFSSWSEPQELSHAFLSGYAEALSAYWIKISSFQIQLGSIDSEGQEHYDIFYEPFEIPLNKVYHKGNWVRS